MRSGLLSLFLLASLGQCLAQSSTPARDQFFLSNGVRIRYVVEGKGEPVILIHGFAGNAGMWGTLAADLSRDYETIAMDCRGDGRSDKPHQPQQYGIEMVNDVVRLMDHLGIKKAHIAGYSMGGSVVMKMLVEHPDRFLTAIVGGSAGYRAGDPNWDASLVKYLQSGMSLSEAMIAAAPPGTPQPTAEQRESMKRMDIGQDPKALAAQRLGNDKLTISYDALKTNRVPTLVIYGGNDHPERFTDLKAVLANGKFAVIEGASHGSAAQSQEFVKDVREFLDSHR
jgi:pimeloyl-ACP methyl ester carboxylesterase